MRKVLLTLTLVCFALISAFANIGENSAHASEHVIEQTQTLKDECPCEKESSASKFVCGVALALPCHATMVQPPLRTKSRFVLSDTAGLKSFVDLLKRPPRTSL